MTDTAAAGTTPRTYKFASWNVNGLRAVLRKEPGFEEIFADLDADILAIQETKLQEGQVELELPGYTQTWSHAERKGYAGTAVFSREEPLSVRRADSLLPFAGEGEAADLVAVAVTEGRVCALEFERFWFVDVYTPNAQNELARIETRMAWDDAYRAFLKGLEEETGKPRGHLRRLQRRPMRRSTSRTPRPTAATPASRTRSAASSPSCSARASPTRSASCTPTRRGRTAGGATALMPARTTQAGASTTSW